MSIRRASKTSRLSIFAQCRTLLGAAGVVMLALYFTPKAAATTTYHATSGYCENENPSQSEVSWNFVLNPTVSNPSTLVATSDYPVGEDLAVGECYWSAFAPAGTLAPSNATTTLSVEYKSIYYSGEGGSNPGAAARINAISNGSIIGGVLHHFSGDLPGGEQITYGPTTASWTLPVGTNLSKVQAEDIANSGDLDTSSVEVDVLSISITVVP